MQRHLVLSSCLAGVGGLISIYMVADYQQVELQLATTTIICSSHHHHSQRKKKQAKIMNKKIQYLDNKLASYYEYQKNYVLYAAAISSKLILPLIATRTLAATSKIKDHQFLLYSTSLASLSSSFIPLVCNTPSTKSNGSQQGLIMVELLLITKIFSIIRKRQL